MKKKGMAKAGAGASALRIKNENGTVLPLLREAGLVYRALSHPLRVAILNVIHQKGEEAPDGICQALGLKRLVVYRHLGVLRAAGLVTLRQEKQLRYYAVRYERIQEFRDLLLQLVTAASQG